MFRELSKVFDSPARLKLLRFFSAQPAQRFTGEEAALTVGVSRKNVEPELRSLIRAGLIQKKAQGKKMFYSYRPEHVLAEPVRAFLENATTPNDKDIMEEFRGVSGITLVVATGMLMNDTRPALDLLIVTKRPKHPGIGKAMRKLEASVALPLRYAILESAEYKSRLEANDRLLRDVFDFAHRVVTGRA